MNLKLVTNEGIKLERSNVLSITLTTTNGVITVLKDHIDFVGQLMPGYLEIITSKETFEIAIGEGAINISANEITIVSNMIEHDIDIDIELVKKSIADAEKFIANNTEIPEVEYLQLLNELEKNKIKYRYKRNRISFQDNN